MLRWYLIHTKSSGEGPAQINLERQNYEVYFPRLLQTARIARGWRERVAALFPRYLFVRLDDDRQTLSPVRSTIGVASVVRFGSQYAVVPNEVVCELRDRADPKSGLHRIHRGRALFKGTPVTITGGPLAGLPGVFEREAGAERVIVLLKLLGCDALVRLSAADVLSAVAM